MFLWSIIAGLFLSITTLAGTWIVDQFQGLQGHWGVVSEWQTDVNESILLGAWSLTMTQRDVSADGFMADMAYRRYVNQANKGVFYSFGLRAGQATVTQGDITENEWLMVPYYDAGVKAQLSQRWFHYLKLEVSVNLLYTDQINVDHWLGIQLTPSFAFGYQL